MFKLIEGFRQVLVTVKPLKIVNLINQRTNFE